MFSDGVEDIALIDAVLLADDFTGNLLPFDERKIRRILLTRAEPDAIGMSPVGGFIDVVEEGDDVGLLLELEQSPECAFKVPLSPGLFKDVTVRSTNRIPFEVPVVFKGQGVLALDGDREHELTDERSAFVTLRRDGPHVYDVRAAMRYAVAQGIMAPPPGGA